MLGPSFAAGNFIWLALRVCHLNIGLLCLAEEILAQEIQYCVDTFLRIVLAVTFKLLSIASKYLFKHGGSNNWLITVPHLIEKFGECLNKSPLGAKGIILVEISLESLIQKVLSELPAIAQALQAAIHVASVAKVAEANLTISGSLASLETRDTLLELIISEGTTRWQMPSLILVQAFGCAILDSLAGTFNLQDLALCAEFTLPDVDSLILQELEGETLTLVVSYLYNNYSTFQSVIFQSLGCRNEWLECFTRELYIAVDLKIRVSLCLILHYLVISGLLANILACIDQVKLLPGEFPEPDVDLRQRLLAA